MKMPKANLVNLEIVELSGVDRPCHAPALVALMKRAPDAKGERPSTSIVKSCMYTDEVDGHQHKIEVCEDGSVWCCAATSSGADFSHSHAVVLESGALTILADSGHTHVLAEGQPGVVVVPEDAMVLVAARAPKQDPETRKSTPSDNPSKVDTMKPIVLSEAQFAHYSKLSGSDAEAFVAKSFAERDAEIQKAIAADPEVYKTDSGISIRKSHGEVALMLAKQADENARALTKANELAQTEKSAREATELQKRASAVFKGVAGTDKGHAAILGAVEKLGDAEVLTELKAIANAAADYMKSQARAPGFGGEDPNASHTPLAKFNAALSMFAKSIGKAPNAATGEFLRTPEGADLYAETRRDGN